MRKVRRKPDFVLRAKVATDKGHVETVPMRVYLPELPTGKVLLELRPSKPEYKPLSNWFKASLIARGPMHIRGTGLNEIESSTMYFGGSHSTFWGEGLDEPTVHCEPTDLRVTQLSAPDATEHGKCHVTFWLTANRHLSPIYLEGIHFDGSSSVDRGHPHELAISPEVLLKFDRHYFWSNRGRTGQLRRSTLVAYSDLASDAHSPLAWEGGVCRELDDFLLLVSAASSTRITCIGWEASDARGVTRFYRRATTMPTGKPFMAMDVGLLPLHHFRAFLVHAWPRMQCSPYREVFRTVAIALAPIRAGTFEATYLRLFSALEEALLAYRRMKGMEFVLPIERWRGLEENLKASIREFEPEVLTSEQRSLMYDKLREVNRIPLRRAFERFTVDCNIELRDLWPVFGPDGCGLANLRNKLVHGDLPDREALKLLSVALDHLLWTLQRVFLALLEWPTDKSEVASAYLSRVSTSIRDRDRAIQELRPVLSGRQ